MSAMCRICMITNCNDGKRIYDYNIETSEVELVCDQIMSICNVIISKEDGRSDVICLSCLQELKNALTFKYKCEKTDEILRSVNVTKSEDVELEFIEEIKTEPKEELIYSENEVPVSNLETVTPEKKYVITNLKYECDECGIKFKKKLERSYHMRLHIYTCNCCKRQYKNKLTLEKHLRIRNQDCIDISTDENITIEGVGKNRIFCCTRCKYKSKRILELKTHIVTHTGSKPFQCNMCPNAYTQFGSLHYHKINIHRIKVKVIICEICGKNMSTKQQLYKHLQTHTDKTFQCKICNSQLKSKLTLSIHMTRHSGVKNYNCEQCGATFFTQAELCNHRKTHLDNVRLFPCSFCEFRAKTKSALKSHVEKHSKKKPFSCNICGRLFINAQRLSIHKIIIHNKERNLENKLQCPICLTMFNHMKSLRRHIVNHHTINAGVDAEISCNLEQQSTKIISKADNQTKVTL